MSKCEHIELATDDPNKARDFYAKLFRWTITAMPNGGGGDYLLFQTDNGGGGIAGKMAPQQPTAWMPYFTVKSVNESLAAAGKLGAQVQMGYTSIGEMGAIAVLVDPTGAAFGLWESNRPAAPPKKAAAPAAKKAAAPAKKPAAKKSAPAKKAPAKKKK
jgi:predicted enzyme related to lactoylglutathione lyase